jgi:polar amino acid transport system substrate-binding protein
MKLLKSLGFMWIAPVALVIAFAASVGNAQNIRQDLAASSALETIKKRGTLRVGHASFVPWAMRSKTGETIGYEIDIASRLAKDAGWAVEFVPTAFDGIIPALLAGKFDIIITGMAQTQKRNLTVNFTIPYQRFVQGIAVNKTLTAGMTHWRDLNRAGVNIASRRGGFTKDIILATFPKATVRWFDDDAQVFQEVINGRAHAAFGPEPKPTFFVLQYGDVLTKPFKDSPVPSIPGAFAVRKGDYDFINFLNNWISQRQFDGWMDERRNYWFASMGWFDNVEKNPFKRK